MQHQPNIAAALSVATHCNGPVLLAPLPPLCPVRPAYDIDLDRSQWSPVVEARC